MGFFDNNDLMNSMGMGVTPVPPATSSGGWTPEDRALIDRTIERQREIADREYSLNKRRVDNEYKVRLQQAKTERDVYQANKWYQEQQVEIARERLSFDRDSFAQRLAFDREVHADTLGLNRAKLGYDVLNMAANMRGAENYFQASNFMRGVANDPNSSTFLTALKNNARMPDFTAQYAAPDANTFSALTAKLGTPLGGTTPTLAAPANADNAYLGQIHALAAAGGHKIGAGGLEQLSGDELKLLQSGMETPLTDASGRTTAYNFNDFLEQYKRSRIGQGTSGAGYRAA